MKYILLFIIGIIELFLGIIDFKLTQKNKIILSSISTFIGVLLWYAVIRTIVEFVDNIYIAIMYALGCSIGCYLGLKYEPVIENFIKIQRKGRKIRRGKHKKNRKR